MTTFRRDLTELFRPELKAGGFAAATVREMDLILDRGGVPRDDGLAPGVAITVGGRGTRDGLAQLIRPLLKGGFSTAMVRRMDAILDKAGLSHDASLPSDLPHGDATVAVPSVPPRGQEAEGRVPSVEGEELIQAFEGYARDLHDGRVQAYPDPGTGGKPWTIGWGSTGPDIVKGTIWTQRQAEERFRDHVREFAAKVSRLLGFARTTQAQFDALVSLAYNIGAGNLAGSTLLKKHKAGDYAGAAREFAKWNKAAGRVLHGLTRRRFLEATLYLRRA